MSRCDCCGRVRRIVVTDRDGFGFCAYCAQHPTIRCYVVSGEARRQNGTVARMKRVLFSTPEHVRSDALALLARRRDRGFPWYGDQIRIEDESSSFSVDVPWP